MEIKEVLLTIFLLSILIIAGIFIGDMIRQNALGDKRDFSSIEISIIIAAILLCIELAVISAGKKKEVVDIKEMVKIAKQEIY